MSINPKADLQDIEAQIRLVEKEKVKGKIYKFFNRFHLPFTWKLSTDKWLEILNFKKKQLQEEIEFKKTWRTSQNYFFHQIPYDPIFVFD